MPRYAAIDIGSNSVRMLAADVLPGGRIEQLASDREVTRLGTSVFRNGAISREAMDFVCTVLGRMSQAYRKVDVVGVRAVATAAVRDASNQAEFIERASAAAGSPVEIISGQEEARLIHVGVQSRWPHPNSRVLVIDVGGGSAEIILADNGRLTDAFSKPLGAVRLTEAFLEDDPPSPVQLDRLREFIGERLNPAVRKFGPKPCDRAIATSATAAALVCAVNGIPRARREEADRRRASSAQVKALFRQLCAKKTSGRAKIAGIGPRRAQIIVAGVAVLLECLQRFELPALYHSAAGVRDGIVADLAARRVGADQTSLTKEQRRVAERMAVKFAVPMKHARHVTGFCEVLFDSLKALHKLPPAWGKILEAAALLYDTGHFVSDTGHHKHSQYLVQNSDLPGFTAREKMLTAMLCRFHRKSMPTARHTAFQTLAADDKRALMQLIPLLRLASALDQGKEQRVKSIACETRDGVVVLQVTGTGKVDLELWAAERTGASFLQAYEKRLAVVRARR
ncbi:MAG: Ppx/GppA family phosphatase [Bryobacterales bacterium]|nr:Ppx/GppA family phosphatase [Bryobacterales bacterium]